MIPARWIELEGAENARDVAGLPTADGREVAPRRLLRSGSLQELTPPDVRRLVDEYQVRTIVDLRTGVEVDAEGPGPMTKEELVEIRHLSLFPEAGRTTDAAAVDSRADEDVPVVLPWQERASQRTDNEHGRGATGVYLRYLADRADSVIGALQVIAGSTGSTIVHCAAGKDRTGVVVAFALAEVGVLPEAIVADYTRSAERIEGIYARLSARRVYRADILSRDVDQHRPRPETMHRLLSTMDETHGGVPTWLRNHGWSDDDAQRLRDKLLG